ncbi:hypothetical protein N0A02_06245 [Paraburkholderia acidicola]|uniref:Uncharacterized protein n=1 Tax=Paraburkholderia acidicola TaxID=1912599 RepID=A0ABV1LID6_9BURK
MRQKNTAAQRQTATGTVAAANHSQQKCSRFDLGLTRDLVEEVDRAGGEHTEQCHTHCHCEIHDASGNLPARQQE